MQEVLFVINLRKSGSLSEMLKLFSESPVIKRPLPKNRDLTIHPFDSIGRYISPNSADVDPYQNGSSIYISRLLNSEIGFIPWSDSSNSDISKFDLGDLLLRLEVTAVLDTDMRITNIIGDAVFNKIINQLITKPSCNYWGGGVYKKEPDTLLGLDNDELKITLSNLVEGAISGDTTFLNIAIAYLLVGYSIGSHITSRNYIEEVLERSKCMGMVATDV